MNDVSYVMLLTYLQYILRHQVNQIIILLQIF